MSNHTPWSQEEAEKWARKYASLEEYPNTIWQRQGFLAGMAKAAEMIEASPTVYGDEIVNGWTIDRDSVCTHSAKLVGVRPIKGEK